MPKEQCDKHKARGLLARRFTVSIKHHSSIEEQLVVVGAGLSLSARLDIVQPHNHVEPVLPRDTAERAQGRPTGQPHQSCS